MNLQISCTSSTPSGIDTPNREAIDRQRLIAALGGAPPPNTTAQLPPQQQSHPLQRQQQYQHNQNQQYVAQQPLGGSGSSSSVAPPPLSSSIHVHYGGVTGSGATTSSKSISHDYHSHQNQYPQYQRQQQQQQHGRVMQHQPPSAPPTGAVYPQQQHVPTNAYMYQHQQQQGQHSSAFVSVDGNVHYAHNLNHNSNNSNSSNLSLGARNAHQHNNGSVAAGAGAGARDGRSISSSSGSALGGGGGGSGGLRRTILQVPQSASSALQVNAGGGGHHHQQQSAPLVGRHNDGLGGGFPQPPQAPPHPSSSHYYGNNNSHQTAFIPSSSSAGSTHSNNNNSNNITTGSIISSYSNSNSGVVPIPPHPTSLPHPHPCPSSLASSVPTGAGAGAGGTSSSSSSAAGYYSAIPHRDARAPADDDTTRGSGGGYALADTSCTENNNTNGQIVADGGLLQGAGHTSKDDRGGVVVGEQQLLNSSNSASYQPPLVVTTTGFSVDETQALQRTLSERGHVYSASLTRQTQVVVAFTTRSDKHRLALTNGMAVVSLRWISHFGARSDALLPLPEVSRKDGGEGKRQEGRDAGGGVSPLKRGTAVDIVALAAQQHKHNQNAQQHQQMTPTPPPAPIFAGPFSNNNNTNSSAISSSPAALFADSIRKNGLRLHPLSDAPMVISTTSLTLFERSSVLQRHIDESGNSANINVKPELDKSCRFVVVPDSWDVLLRFKRYGWHTAEPLGTGKNATVSKEGPGSASVVAGSEAGVMGHLGNSSLPLAADSTSPNRDGRNSKNIDGAAAGSSLQRPLNDHQNNPQLAPRVSVPQLTSRQRQQLASMEGNPKYKFCMKHFPHTVMVPLRRFIAEIVWGPLVASTSEEADRLRGVGVAVPVNAAEEHTNGVPHPTSPSKSFLPLKEALQWVNKEIASAGLFYEHTANTKSQREDLYHTAFSLAGRRETAVENQQQQQQQQQQLSTSGEAQQKEASAACANDLFFVRQSPQSVPAAAASSCDRPERCEWFHLLTPALQKEWRQWEVATGLSCASAGANSGAPNGLTKVGDESGRLAVFSVCGGDGHSRFSGGVGGGVVGGGTESVTNPASAAPAERRLFGSSGVILPSDSATAFRSSIVMGSATVGGLNARPDTARSDLNTVISAVGHGGGEDQQPPRPVVVYISHNAPQPQGAADVVADATKSSSKLTLHELRQVQLLTEANALIAKIQEKAGSSFALRTVSKIDPTITHVIVLDCWSAAVRDKIFEVDCGIVGAGGGEQQGQQGQQQQHCLEFFSVRTSSATFIGKDNQKTKSLFAFDAVTIDWLRECLSVVEKSVPVTLMGAATMNKTVENNTEERGALAPPPPLSTHQVPSAHPFLFTRPTITFTGLSKSLRAAYSTLAKKHLGAIVMDDLIVGSMNATTPTTTHLVVGRSAWVSVRGGGEDMVTPSIYLPCIAPDVASSAKVKAILQRHAQKKSLGCLIVTDAWLLKCAGKDPLRCVSGDNDNANEASAVPDDMPGDGVRQWFIPLCPQDCLEIGGSSGIIEPNRLKKSRDEGTVELPRSPFGSSSTRRSRGVRTLEENARGSDIGGGREGRREGGGQGGGDGDIEGGGQKRPREVNTDEMNNVGGEQQQQQHGGGRRVETSSSAAPLTTRDHSGASHGADDNPTSLEAPHPSPPISGGIMIGAFGEDDFAALLAKLGAVEGEGGEVEADMECPAPKHNRTSGIITNNNTFLSHGGRGAQDSNGDDVASAVAGGRATNVVLCVDDDDGDDASTTRDVPGVIGGGLFGDCLMAPPPPPLPPPPPKFTPPLPSVGKGFGGGLFSSPLRTSSHPGRGAMAGAASGWGGPTPPRGLNGLSDGGGLSPSSFHHHGSLVGGGGGGGGGSDYDSQQVYYDRGDIDDGASQLDPAVRELLASLRGDGPATDLFSVGVKVTEEKEAKIGRGEVSGSKGSVKEEIAVVSKESSGGGAGVRGEARAGRKAIEKHAGSTAGVMLVLPKDRVLIPNCPHNHTDAITYALGPPANCSSVHNNAGDNENANYTNNKYSFFVTKKAKDIATQSFSIDVKVLIASCGGACVDSMAEATHYITEKLAKTETFLSCVASGKWLLSPQYLEELSKMAIKRGVACHLLPSHPSLAGSSSRKGGGGDGGGGSVSAVIGTLPMSMAEIPPEGTYYFPEEEPFEWATIAMSSSASNSNNNINNTSNVGGGGKDAAGGGRGASSSTSLSILNFTSSGTCYVSLTALGVACGSQRLNAMLGGMKPFSLWGALIVCGAEARGRSFQNVLKSGGCLNARVMTKSDLRIIAEAWVEEFWEECFEIGSHASAASSSSSTSSRDQQRRGAGQRTENNNTGTVAGSIGSSESSAKTLKQKRLRELLLLHEEHLKSYFEKEKKRRLELVGTSSAPANNDSTASARHPTISPSRQQQQVHPAVLFSPEDEDPKNVPDDVMVESPLLVAVVAGADFILYPPPSTTHREKKGTASSSLFSSANVVSDVMAPPSMAHRAVQRVLKRQYLPVGGAGGAKSGAHVLRRDESDDASPNRQLNALLNAGVRQRRSVSPSASASSAIPKYISADGHYHRTVFDGTLSAVLATSALQNNGGGGGVGGSVAPQQQQQYFNTNPIPPTIQSLVPFPELGPLPEGVSALLRGHEADEGLREKEKEVADKPDGGVSRRLMLQPHPLLFASTSPPYTNPKEFLRSRITHVLCEDKIVEVSTVYRAVVSSYSGARSGPSPSTSTATTDRNPAAAADSLFYSYYYDEPLPPHSFASVVCGDGRPSFSLSANNRAKENKKETSATTGPSITPATSLPPPILRIEYCVYSLCTPTPYLEMNHFQYWRKQ